jgi:protein-S-isoprenylcysteine O-methyltransferase Ste14
MLPLLQTVGWIACVIYATIPSFWLMIHPRVEYWRSRRSPYRVLLPLWVGMWLILGFLTVPLRHAAFYSTPWAWLPAAALFVCGFSIYWHARRNFSAPQLGGFPEILPGHREHRLVTTGIRARVRHPVYLGHLCEMLGWCVGTGQMISYVLTGLAVVTGAIMIRAEDQELEQRFGEEYRLYRRSVSAVLPRF